MAQIDLEALAGGGDAMIACGIQIGIPTPNDPDVPPESTVVPVDGLEWADVVAALIVYEREDSTKGSTNPKAQAEQRQQRAQPKPLSTSQRFSGGLLAKPHIIGLPAKIEHHSGHLDRSGRRGASAPIFTRKLHGPRDGKKSAVPKKEPGSPKVSCMGKVLSERERDQCRRRRHIVSEEVQGSEPAGCWASMLAALCCVAEIETRAAETAYAAEEARIDAKAAMEPPGMGAMRRFASGQGAVAWGIDSDPEADEEHIAESDSLDGDGRGMGRTGGVPGGHAAMDAY